MAMELKEHIPCPFCGLGCDDLSIGVSGRQLELSKLTCPKAKTGFDIDSEEVLPRVGRKNVSYDDAYAAALKILRSSDCPLIGGLSADMSAVKRAVALAERKRGILDHCKGDGYGIQTRVVQEKGWFAATRSEVANRSDLVILIGTQAVSAMPRFFERCVWPQKSFLPERLKNREVVFIGEDWSANLGTSPQGKAVTHIKVDNQHLPAALGLLRQLWKGDTAVLDSDLASICADGCVAGFGRQDAGVFLWRYCLGDGCVYVDLWFGGC